MDIDPIFHRVGGGPVNNLHETEDDQCEQAPPVPKSCDFVSCGAGGTCTTPVGAVEGQTACACVDGSVSRPIPDPTHPGKTQVACVDVRLNFVGDTVSPPVGQVVDPLADPCLTTQCGDHGECVSMNGFPTCRCDSGYVGTVVQQENGEFGLSCVQPEEPLPTEVFTRALREPDLPYPGRSQRVATSVTSAGGCSSSDAPASSLMAMLLGLVGLVRRRRR